MASGPNNGRLFQDSGSSPSDRAREAFDILINKGLQDAAHKMDERERGMVNDVAERVQRYGVNAYISAKQLFWLRDLMEKWL